MNEVARDENEAMWRQQVLRLLERIVDAVEAPPSQDGGLSVTVGLNYREGWNAALDSVRLFLDNAGSGWKPDAMWAFEKVRSFLRGQAAVGVKVAPRHDPTDHDCRGGVPGDRFPL